MRTRIFRFSLLHGKFYEIYLNSVEISILLKFHFVSSGFQMEHIPSQEQTSLGVLDHTAVCRSLEKVSKKNKRKNTTFSDEERYLIGQYASVHGPTAAVKKFKKTHPHLNFGESTARNLRTKYQEQLKRKTGEQSSKISLQKRGRPLMLGALDEKVKNFLHVLRRKGGVVNNRRGNGNSKSIDCKKPG